VQLPDEGPPPADLARPPADLGAPQGDLEPTSDANGLPPDVGPLPSDQGAGTADTGQVLPDAAVDVGQPALDLGAGTNDAGLTPAAGAALLLRDRWGVPHVLSATDRGAGYGLGWAQAQDQAETVLRALWRVQGRASEIDGEQALAADRAARLLRLVDHARAGWPALEQPVRDLVEGFVAGFDASLDAQPGARPGWAEPVDPVWVVALGQLFFLAPQVHRANAKAAAICAGLDVLPLPGMGPAATPASNAWAVTAGRSASGAALHLTDPHLPLQPAWRLYEAHVRGATFEVAGATFVGLPLPMMGRNAQVAWGWTWNEPDHADVYQLGLHGQDPGWYVLDGVATPFEEAQASFRLPDGQVLTETLRWSVHGPVVCSQPGLGWAVAYRLSAWGRSAAAEQLMQMARSGSVDDLAVALQRLEVAHFNNVAADTAGHVAYVYNARIPTRPAGLDHRRPLDGRSAAAVWPLDTPLPLHELPSVHDPACGFVQSCNNAPWVTTGTGDDPLAADFVPGLGFDLADTERAWRVRRTLAGAEPVSLDAALALATDRTMIPAEPLLPLLDAAWLGWGDAHPDSERLQPAVDLLLAWDGLAAAEELAPTLFWAFAYALFDSAWVPLEVLSERPEDLTPARAAQLLDALVAALDTLEQRFGGWMIPWGEVHALEHGGTRLPVSSGAYPAVSLMHCTVDPDAEGPPACVSGSAYTLLTSLEQPPRSWSVLALGNRDGAVPWPERQDELYSRGELKPLPVTDDELRAHAWRSTLLEVPDAAR